MTSRPQEPTANDLASKDAHELDFFDSVLSLEDQYHEEGYNLGVADGARAGRTEGRIFGIEKGFEKYVAMARMGGRAAVWNANLDSSESTTPMRKERLRNHILRLAELTDASTLSTSNNEEAVSDFDERFAGAQAKTRLISNSLGQSSNASDPRRQEPRDSGDPESSAAAQPINGHAASMNRRRAPPRSSEMEDFAGLPRTSSRRETENEMNATQSTD